MLFEHKTCRHDCVSMFQLRGSLSFSSFYAVYSERRAKMKIDISDSFDILKVCIQECCSERQEFPRFTFSPKTRDVNKTRSFEVKAKARVKVKVKGQVTKSYSE